MLPLELLNDLYDLLTKNTVSKDSNNVESVANVKSALVHIDPVEPSKSRTKEYNKLQSESQRLEKIEVDAKHTFYFLRKKWSWTLFGLLIAITLFQFTLTILIGCGILRYLDYKIYLQIQIIEFFGQILSLCAVVVLFLFRESKSDSKENLERTKKPGRRKVTKLIKR